MMMRRAVANASTIDRCRMRGAACRRWAVCSIQDETLPAPGFKSCLTSATGCFDAMPNINS
jgi:hypothetical protein